MSRNILLSSLCTVLILLLSGCTVRHYVVTKDRVDQDLNAGNRGYIAGKTPETLEEQNRRMTRDTYVTKIELPVLGKKQEAVSEPEQAEPARAGQELSLEENLPESSEYSTEKTIEAGATVAAQPQAYEKYTVASGDTLEKISKKFYGTVRKWNEIFKANKDILKAPNKIYPGQVLNIPVETLKEPKENLK